IKSSSHRWLRGRPGYGPGGKLARLHIYLCIAVTLGERAVMPHIGRQVQPDAVVSAAGCRIDKHLGKWPAQASREPAVPDPPEAAQQQLTVHHTELLEGSGRTRAVPSYLHLPVTASVRFGVSAVMVTLVWG